MDHFDIILSEIKTNFCDSEIQLYCDRVTRKIAINGDRLSRSEAMELCQSITKMVNLLDEEA